MALLPALVGKHFRRLPSLSSNLSSERSATSGIYFWSKLIRDTRASHPSAAIRHLSFIARNHLLSAFLRYSDSSVHNAEAWLFSGAGVGAFMYLDHGFELKAIHAPNIEVNAANRAKSLLVVSWLPSYVFGLTAFIRLYAPTPFDAAGPSLSPSRNATSTTLEGLSPDKEYRYLSIIWPKLAQELMTILGSPFEPTIEVAWATIASMFKPPSPNDVMDLDILINGSFLDGSVAKAKSIKVQNEVAMTALARCCKPSHVPGWATRWLMGNMKEVLAIVEACLVSICNGPADTEWEYTNKQEKIMPVRFFICQISEGVELTVTRAFAIDCGFLDMEEFDDVVRGRGAQ